MTENEITEKVIGCAMKIHTALGPGLLESAYKFCLIYELNTLGLFVSKEHPLPLIYKEVHLECGYRADLFVENKVIVEIKSVDALNDLHMAQTITYLKLSGSRLDYS